SSCSRKGWSAIPTPSSPTAATGWPASRCRPTSSPSPTWNYPRAPAARSRSSCSASGPRSCSKPGNPSAGGTDAGLQDAPPAVDDQRLAGDERSGVAGQEQHGGGHLGGVAGAPHWDPVTLQLEQLVEEVLGHLG